MKQDYKKQLSKIFPFADADLEELLNAASIKEVPSMTTLLSEGEIATKLLVVFKGCLREYFIKEDGKEITFQFFVENQIVASFESAIMGTPSRLYIETIEDSTIGFIPMKAFGGLLSKCRNMEGGFNKFLMKRLIYYMNRCSSYILDNPEKRYVSLVNKNPELVARVPQQYIASYLGVTPVSLSRIRGRFKKKISKN